MDKKYIETREDVTIKFAGDSGDGMQLTGYQFTNTSAVKGNDVATFPDFPAEIRAPQGTLAGVSGFQVHFGSREVFTPGDDYDVLVAMNAAALKRYLGNVKKGGTVITNISGFDNKNLRLAKYEKDAEPLKDEELLANYRLIEMDITKLTKECLADTSLSKKDVDRSKNMFVLGFLYWMYDRDLDSTIAFLKNKFDHKPDIRDANIKTLKAGYHYGDTTETFTTRYEVKAAPMEPGVYRSIMGNQALVIGLITAAQKAGLPLVYASYPITPASDILHGLSKYKNYGVKTFQAEDEIAAMCAAVGAAYGGNLAVTGTSGPGMALKTEAMGLALMLELPLLIIDVQRGGPSTGLPTKTEQADLLQAMYGRNGESPLPVLAAHSPSDCFETVIEACRIALRHIIPVIVLSDGYIANGAEPWKFPKADDIAPIDVSFKKQLAEGEDEFLPYQRDENLARPWVLPGTPGLAHRVGGLEKEDQTGNVSYNPANHEFMVKTRAARVEKIADFIPDLEVDMGPDNGELLVLGWGSTYGVIRSAVNIMLEEGHKVSHAHLRYLNPFPKNLPDIMNNFKQILIPEMNNGQLAKLIREKYLIEPAQYNKIQGIPISKRELVGIMKKMLQ